MPSKIPDFIIRIMAEGYKPDRRLEAEEIHDKANLLAQKLPLPPQRQMYVGYLLKRALKGELDPDIFKEFVRITNTYLEVEQVAPRIKMLLEKEV